MGKPIRDDVAALRPVAAFGRLRSAAVLRRLQQFESRNVTFIDPDGSWPIVWSRARGVHVWDCEGRRYLDLTAAFGVAAAGHAHPRVITAARQQMSRLLHAMGDVHPHPLKAELARRLSQVTFERWPGAHRGKTIFGSAGFEAVEAALKTALLATGKPGVIAFEGAYHGLGYGALTATHRRHFRSPFRRQLREFCHFAPYPADASQLRITEERILRLCRRHPIGAILVEPVQGRAGIRVPPAEFLPRLRRLADRSKALLVLDEVYTGFGRTGKWFACEHTGTVPDLICLGKAMTGGFPLSACVGRDRLMDRAWPPASGEALHTSTFLGHPVGCAMALAQMSVLQSERLIERSARLGGFLLERLSAVSPKSPLTASARGIGLMIGLELRGAGARPATRETWSVIRSMLASGFILLPEGEHGNVISLTPPLTISQEQLEAAAGAIAAGLETLSPA